MSDWYYGDDDFFIRTLNLIACSDTVCVTSDTYSHVTRSTTVDREIFVVKNFSPVAWAAKIKRTKIKYTYTHFTAELSGGEN